MATPRVTLVAHATTKALRVATFGGDDGIDDVGRRKAEAVAGSLGKVDRVYISPALRARETAAALGLENAIVDERLRETDFGKWTGLKFGQVLLRQPRALYKWIKDPAKAPHGG